MENTQNLPPKPAHMFTNARNVTINGGDYHNVSGGVIAAKGPAIDPSRTRTFQKKLLDTRERYGGNTDVSAFEDFSGNINRAGKIHNVAGGRFSVAHERDHDMKRDPDDSSNTSPLSPKGDASNDMDKISDKMETLKTSKPFPPTSSQKTLPPTCYEASMFKGSDVENLEFDNLSNIGMADLSGLNLSPEDTAKIFEAIMATHNEYASSMTATMFSGVKSKNVKIRNAVNIAGAAFSQRR